MQIPVSKSRSFIAAALLAAGVGTAAGATDFSDPTWPCIQRKVERLSVGLMWPHPIEVGALSPETEAAVEDLADRFALRRLNLEEIEPDLAEFIAAHGRDSGLLGHVFARAFDRLAGTRRAVIKGIGDYSLSQIALARKIDQGRSEMAALMEIAQPDYDRVDKLEEQLDWDERIYTDRASSLTYVCETPVLLEKRLYGTARMLLDAIGD